MSAPAASPKGNTSRMNQDFNQNRKRPRRYKGRPGATSQPNPAEPSDMETTVDESADVPPDIAQDIAEARMAEIAAMEAPAQDGSPAGNADAATATQNPPSNNQQGGQRPPRDANPNQQQQAAAQARREADQARREAENQRRQQEQARRDQERVRREDETRRRQQDQARREAEERARLPTDDLCKKAWDIYLAEVSEEGVELFPDNDARELARRSFRLAEIFLLEEIRARRPPPPPSREESKPAEGGGDSPQSTDAAPEPPTPAADPA